MPGRRLRALALIDVNNQSSAHPHYAILVLIREIIAMKASVLPAGVLALLISVLPFAALAAPHGMALGGQGMRGPALGIRGPALGMRMGVCPPLGCLSAGAPHIATPYGARLAAPYASGLTRWQNQAIVRQGPRVLPHMITHKVPGVLPASKVPGVLPASAKLSLPAEKGKLIYPPGRKLIHDRALADLSPRDPTARRLATTTFGGKFTDWRDHDGDHHHHDHDHDHCWWRCGFVIGWIGWVWWPYAYADLWDYTLWRYGYDGFWPYAYDDLYSGIYGGYAPYQYDYVPSGYASRPAATPVAANAASRRVAPPPATSGAICTGQESGLTDWPIERIAEQVQPNDVERALLDKLKDATAQTVTLLQSACPTDLPSTPTGRLGALQQRIAAMLQAVRVIEPALADFYHSLSDEQKERFNALDGAPVAAAKRVAEPPDPAHACSSQITTVPIDRIGQVLRLDQAQRDALANLNKASSDAADILRKSCPEATALTPPGRVAEMEQRLNAMLQAVDIVQPALAQFYNALSDEQKARFNRMPRTA